MFFVKLFKYCFRGADYEPEVLPLMRIAKSNPMHMSITSHLPISAKLIPHLEVTASSSTATAMFEHEAIASMDCRHNSFTTNDIFEDVDLSTPTNFCAPPKARKLSLSPFDDKYEIESALVTPGSLKEANCDGQVPKVSTSSSIPLLVHAKQSTPTTSSNIYTSPFDDKHHVESDAEVEVEYAPTTPSSGSDYAERAMEYQRVSLLFGHDRIEYYNLQRGNALAVLEGTKPHSNEPLDPELVELLAIRMGCMAQY